MAQEVRPSATTTWTHHLGAVCWRLVIGSTSFSFESASILHLEFEIDHTNRISLYADYPNSPFEM